MRNVHKKRARDKQNYLRNKESKRQASRNKYWKNPEKQRASSRAYSLTSYWKNPEKKRASSHTRYWEDPETKRASSHTRYWEDPETKSININNKLHNKSFHLGCGYTTTKKKQQKQVTKKFAKRKQAHVGMKSSKTNQTGRERHHNTFTPSLHLVPFATCTQHKTLYICNY